MENKIITKIENVNGQLVVSSRIVAEQLGKRHSDVLESIERILTNGDFRSLIILSEYKDKKGEMRKEYLLTEKGFTLYMFNIQGFNDYKLAYINEFERMKKELNAISSKEQYLLDILRANGDLEKTIAIKNYEDNYVKPLENNLEQTTKKLNHKQEVVNLLVDEVKLKTQRQFLNEIIKMRGVDLIAERGKLLYNDYSTSQHINLKARMEAYNLVHKPKIKSILQFIDEVLNDIPTLYKLATKLFESDFKDKLQKYMDAL